MEYKTDTYSYLIMQATKDHFSSETQFNFQELSSIHRDSSLTYRNPIHEEQIQTLMDQAQFLKSKLHF